jgi:hypothetical protein
MAVMRTFNSLIDLKNAILNKTATKEKRMFQRYNLVTESHLRSINHKNDKELQRAKINIVNISESGICFESDTSLNDNYFYEINLILLHKIEVNSVVKVVRKNKKNKIYEYGAMFIGLTDKEKWLINSYCIFYDHHFKE